MCGGAASRPLSPHPWQRARGRAIERPLPGPLRRCGARIHHLAGAKPDRQPHLGVGEDPQMELVRRVHEPRLGRIDLEALVLLADDGVLDPLQIAPVVDGRAVAALDRQPEHVAGVRPEGRRDPLDVDLVALVHVDALAPKRRSLRARRFHVDPEARGQHTRIERAIGQARGFEGAHRRQGRLEPLQRDGAVVQAVRAPLPTPPARLRPWGRPRR